MSLDVDGELGKEECDDDESSEWLVVSTAQRGAFGEDERSDEAPSLRTFEGFELSFFLWSRCSAHQVSVSVD